jgi:hypothetical protein
MMIAEPGVLPPDPRDSVRDRWRELDTEDRPGSPFDVPFDPRPSRAAFWIRTACQLAAVTAFTATVWIILS